MKLPSSIFMTILTPNYQRNDSFDNLWMTQILTRVVHDNRCEKHFPKIIDIVSCSLHVLHGV